MHLMDPLREPSAPAALPLADFEELLSNVQHQLFGFARGLTSDAEQASDVVQGRLGKRLAAFRPRSPIPGARTGHSFPRRHCRLLAHLLPTAARLPAIQTEGHP